MPFAQDYVDENLAAFQAQITQLQGKCKSPFLLGIERFALFVAF